METLEREQTIQLEELDTLARLLLPEQDLQNAEPGLATALAYEAGKLALEGTILNNPAVQAAIDLALTAA